MNWNVLERYRLIYKVAEFCVVGLLLPLIVLLVYIIYTQTPKNHSAIKHLFLGQLLTHVLVAFSVASVQPIKVPNYMGGFAQGLLGRLNYSYFVGTYVIAASSIADGLLNILAFFLQAQTLVIKKSRAVLWLVHGNNILLVTGLAFAFAYSIASLILVGYLNDHVAIESVIGDAVLNRLKVAEPSFFLTTHHSPAICIYFLLAANMLAAAFALSIYLACRAHHNIQLNEKRVRPRTFRMEMNILKFLILKLVCSVIGFYVPVALLLVAAHLQDVSYPLSMISYWLLGAHSLAYCVLLVGHITFYRNWVLEHVCRQDTRVRSLTISSSMDKEGYHVTTTMDAVSSAGCNNKHT